MTDGEVRRNPVPSLLRSLMTDHLDPGYAAAAEDRARGHSLHRPLHTGSWCVAGGVVLGLIFGIAYAQAGDRAPGTDQVRSEILGKVHAAEERGSGLAGTRDELAARTDALRSRALAGDSEGSAVLAQLVAMEQAAGLDAVHGGGLTVTLTDPAAQQDLSDRGRPGAGAAKAVVLDRDIASVVNALWSSGAEAVAVGGVRIGPSATIRQAGGAMLVDNQPVFSPYAISAIGPVDRLQTGYLVSDAYLRMSGIAQLYGVGFTVAEEEDVSLPVANAREIRTAREVDGQ